MLVVFAIAIWKKVPAAIGKALDKKIAAIRDQLAEAAALRQDAKELRQEYQAKAATADNEAAAMIERAKAEAGTSSPRPRKTPRRWSSAARRWRKRRSRRRACRDRRTPRNRCQGGDRAAAKLIAERNDAKTDQGLVDEAIAGLAKR